MTQHLRRLYSIRMYSRFPLRSHFRVIAQNTSEGLPSTGMVFSVRDKPTETAPIETIMYLRFRKFDVTGKTGRQTGRTALLAR
jgi:hypothetical protein